MALNYFKVHFPLVLPQIVLLTKKNIWYVEGTPSTETKVAILHQIYSI